MKKYVILVMAVGVCWLGFSYHKQQQVSKAENLVTAAYYGDLIGVKNAVEDGADLEYVLAFDEPDRGYTGQYFNALHAAASSGNEDVILFLLEQQLAIDSRTPQGWTALFVAARDGRAEAAKLLVYRGANLNAQSDLGATALMMAVTQPFETEKARLDLLTYLLRRGADANLTDRYGHTALYYAKAQKNKEVANLLSEYGAK